MRIGSGSGTSGLEWLLDDQLGSTTITADGATGAKLSELRYKPWGEIRYAYKPTMTDLRYTGQRFEGIGLYDYGARWYDAALGRFVQADTVVASMGDPQAWDRYAYVYNNPVKFVDPTGHCALLEEDSNGLCIRNDSNIQIVRGGSVFRNPVEKALANYLLSGNTNQLRNVPEDSYPADINRALANVTLELGLKDDSNSWMDLLSDPNVILGSMLLLAPQGNNKFGETTDTIRGREAHYNYRYALGPDYDYKVRLPSGLRPDAVDWENHIVRELKPDRPIAIQRGWSQLRKYISELFEETGDLWTGFVDTYRK